MRLPDLLAADRILVGAPGETVRDTARALMHAILASGVVRDSERLEDLLAEALPNEAVTVGQQAFLLHFRTDAVESVVAALAVTAQPVHRQHDPGKASRVVLLLLAPSREGTTYLRILAAFARALARDDVIGELEGAASAEEILASPALAAIEVPEELLVRDVVPRAAPVTVTLETSLIEAARLMIAHRIAVLPVVSEEHEMLGVVGHGELLQHLLPRHGSRTTGEHPAAGRARLSTAKARDVAVRDVMDRSVLCLSEEQSLTDAAALMVSKRLERVPVVREGALVGILSREDIVRRLFGP